MATLFVNGIETEDRWLTVEGGQPLPSGENLIVALDYLTTNKVEVLARKEGRLGVHLDADEQIDAISDALDHLTLVSLDFPSFADGRSFSKARNLRDKHNFIGEIRAVGDVRIDQVNHMKRCGFDSLLISHPPTLLALSAAKDPSISLYYQPALGDGSSLNGRSWARRAIT